MDLNFVLNKNPVYNQMFKHLTNFYLKICKYNIDNNTNNNKYYN